MTSACETCGGTGEVEIRVHEGGEWSTDAVECDDCGGSGQEPDPEPRTVTIPANPEAWAAESDMPADDCPFCAGSGLDEGDYCSCEAGQDLEARERDGEPYESDGEQAEAWFASAYGHGEDDYEPADPYEGGW